MEKKEPTILQGLATVSSCGLEFNGRIYSNANMIRHQWFELAAVQGSWQIPIFYNPERPEELMLFDFITAEVATSVETKECVCEEIKATYFEAINSLKERISKIRANDQTL